MRRRDFLVLLGSSLVANPMAATGQKVTPSRIGFLRVGPPPPTYIGGFREGLQEQGTHRRPGFRHRVRAGAECRANTGNGSPTRPYPAGHHRRCRNTFCLPGQGCCGSYPCSVRSNLRSGRDGTGPKPSSTCWECDRFDHDKRRPCRKTDGVDQRILPSLHEGRDPGPRSPVRLHPTTYNSRGSQLRSWALSCKSLPSASLLILRSYSSLRVPRTRWW